MFVPVKSKSGKKLMPTKPNKAGMLIKKGLATPYVVHDMARKKTVKKTRNSTRT